MNATIKKLWIKALRSGKYKQTRNSLKDTDGYCCLGVLTDLYIKDQNAQGKKCCWVASTEEIRMKLKGADDKVMGGILPKIVSRWAGLREIRNPWVEAGKRAGDSCTEMNDVRKYPFKKIADLIEADKSL